MDVAIDRRTVIQGAAVAGAYAAIPSCAFAASDNGPIVRHRREKGIVKGLMTGAQAVVETLLVEGADCVYGIPGAQENELWDVFKAKNLPYLLVTHEFSAACMADGYARSTGKPGVLCVVPGPGVTNALTGIGEALLDSVPMVCIVGDIAQGEKYKPFQVHCLDQMALLQPVTKLVLRVSTVQEIPGAIRNAFATACDGEPGPVAVVIPYTLLVEQAAVDSPPLSAPPLAWDAHSFSQCVQLLRNKHKRVGIYAGMGCMDYSQQLVAVAEMLQAPVATSVSGKGCFPESHPLSVGWGYGPQASLVAEKIFLGDRLHPLAGVDCILAIGVKYSEVSTGYYSNPAGKTHIHVDSCADNLGKIHSPTVCVHADAGVFLASLLAQKESLCRDTDVHLQKRIEQVKAQQTKEHTQTFARCGIDPMELILKLRQHLPEDALYFVDVTVSEHMSAEAFRVHQPRTYFNPTDNQSMGWSIPAAIGAQKVHPGRVVATLTGDGCLLMSAMELSTAAREKLPVKFFILDDQAYHYMQMLQQAAYNRTTATHLARIDYSALAQAMGIAYQEIDQPAKLDAAIRGAICYPGPVLVRVVADYGNRKVRWIEAVRAKYTKELSAGQKARFASRLGTRVLSMQKQND